MESGERLEERGVRRAVRGERREERGQEGTARSMVNGQCVNVSMIVMVKGVLPFG